MTAQSNLTWPSERLAYWYFRLNGFLTIEDFVVHPDEGRDVRTDVDVLAVRFKHRIENVVRPMIDDSTVSQCDTYANVVLAEVTTGRCKLNGPWTNQEKENMHRVLGAVGCLHEDRIESAAHALYERGFWSNDLTTVRVFAIGESRSDLLIPREQQLFWPEIIAFCVTRFKEYASEKSSTGQWTEDGRTLKDIAQ